MPPAFFAAGRPYARLESSAAHFRSLRKTPVIQWAKAIAFTEQVWELVYALEQRVQLLAVDLPGFGAGEVNNDEMPSAPAAAAQELRRRWSLGTARIPQLVRTMERHGIVVTLTPFAGPATKNVDAFSTSHLPRPVRADTGPGPTTSTGTASPRHMSWATCCCTPTSHLATQCRSARPMPSPPSY